MEALDFTDTRYRHSGSIAAVETIDICSITIRQPIRRYSTPDRLSSHITRRSSRLTQGSLTDGAPYSVLVGAPSHLASMRRRNTESYQP